MEQSDSPSTELIMQQANKPGLNPMNQDSSPFMFEKQILIAYPVKETGLGPMYQYSLPYLRERCDEFIPRVDGASATKVERVRNAAKLALNVYNQKEQKNFNLEKVVKLNDTGPYFCMTFRAKNAEIDECRIFRGVVNGLSKTVLLCEIKEPDHIAVPSDLDENYVEALSESKEDHSPYTEACKD